VSVVPNRGTHSWTIVVSVMLIIGKKDGVSRETIGPLGG
jgi:hypothetical protein